VQVTQTAPPHPDVTQIRWYVGLGTGTDPVQLKAELAVVDDFNKTIGKDKKINLVMEVIPYDSAKDTLSTEIAAGNGPDIVGPVGWGGSNAFYGQWLDIAPYIKSSGYDTAQFDPALLASYETSQGQVGLPFAVFPSMIFYNTKLFDEAGLNPLPSKYGEKYKMPDGTEAEWSWETLSQVARLLTVDGAGKNATEAGFDKTTIKQYGYTWQYENHPSYWGAFWANGTMLADGGSAGSYKAQAPDAWKAAWKWTYDAIWGDKPFIANGQVEGSADYASGNPFNSGKVAMTDEPLWYTCCMNDVAKDVEFAPMPAYNGKVNGRIDADTFRIWKGTKNPEAAFTVLTYLTGEGVQKLIVGSKDMPGAYGALPARAKDQGPFIEAKKAVFTNAKNWDLINEGLKYPDTPSAEGWLPNYNEAWNRGNTFSSLLRNTAGLDVDKEIATYVNDLTVIYNK
jgi:multiple sugar transport system substrate-binding protein